MHDIDVSLQMGQERQLTVELLCVWVIAQLVVPDSDVITTFPPMRRRRRVDL